MELEPNDDVTMLSDKELLDSVEKLLCSPGFIDLDLGYDAASRTFYAGSEVASSLRDILRRVLRENRPSGVSLKDVVGRSCLSAGAGARAESVEKGQSDGYLTQLPLG